jgi:predicted Zn-dependent peptidase
MPIARKSASLVALSALLIAMGAGCSRAPQQGRRATGLESLERSVQEFTLGNGIRFLLVERHDSPVFSYETVVDAGSADDTPGATGLAHMMEHMAFKGTPWVGARDAAAEAPLLEAEENAYQALASERVKGAHTDSAQVRRLEKAFATAQAAAEQQVEPEEFSRILERAGARDVNAETSSDVTAYTYSIPSNQLELWALMEGGRLAHPVFRQFYREREVVIEERRMNTESSPFGRLADAFVHAAFTVHPYGQGTIGAAADLKTLTRTEGEAFFHRHYIAPAMTVAVVGDVTLDELRKVAERYFADVPGGPAPAGVQAVEPEQRAERRAVLNDAAQPIVMVGWHMPACTDPRFEAYQALADLLGGGDYARLQRALVRDRAIAVDVQTTTGFPGEKYPGLYGVLAVPAEGMVPDSLERGVESVVEDVRTAHPFTQAELDGYKVRVRAQKLAAVEENASLAHELGHAQALHRDWHAFFREQVDVQSLTLDDLTRALGTFTAQNRVVAMLVPPPAASRRGH